MMTIIGDETRLGPLDRSLSPGELLAHCPWLDCADKLGRMARLSILIVDTDSELAQIIGSFLNFRGYRVNYTSRVREAVGKLALQKYSCIILEPDLHGDRGEEVIRAATDPAGLNGRTPFILTTAKLDHSLPPDVVSQIRAILPKPFTFEQLLGAIEVALPIEFSARAPS